MGLADAFGKEDRVEVTFSDFYKLMKESAKCELVLNAVNCNVPHQYIRKMASGKLDKILSESASKTTGKEAGQPGLASATLTFGESL